MNTVSVTPFSQNECVYFPLIASLCPVHFVSASSETVLVSITKRLSFNCVEGSWVAVSPYTFFNISFILVLCFSSSSRSCEQSAHICPSWAFDTCDTNCTQSCGVVAGGTATCLIWQNFTLDVLCDKALRGICVSNQ